MSGRRPPKPNRQQVAAAATRHEILLAARRLFGERGYSGVSIAELAEEAGVSIPTIYASVGPKQAIALSLVELIDLQLGGAETRARLAGVTDPSELLAIGTHVNRALQENFGDIVKALRSAAQVEPAVAKAVANGEQRHRMGATATADRLQSLGALRSGMTTREAADIIGLLTDPESYARLVDNYGWTLDRAEEWITGALRTLLLRAGDHGLSGRES